MKKLITFSIICFFFSCSSNKRTIINEFIKEIKTPLNGKNSDSILIVDKSYNINPSFFKSYLKAEEYSKRTNIYGDFNWIKNYIWSLSKEDISYLENEAIKSKTIKFKKKCFVGNVKLVQYDSIINSISNKTNEKAIVSGLYTYSISSPIFNKKKDIAIIYLNTLIPNNSRQLQRNKTVIYKKENNNWFKICLVGDSIE